jgi:hypothetical protein
LKSTIFILTCLVTFIVSKAMSTKHGSHGMIIDAKNGSKWVP